MKLYLAAPWADKDKMPSVAKEFINAGHIITHSWWEVENIPESERKATLLRDQAIKDVEGVKAAQMIIVINTAKSEGKSVEQGIAIAQDKPIIAVGKRGELSANVFHYLGHYKWVESVSEAITVLETIKWLLGEGDASRSK